MIRHTCAILAGPLLLATPQTAISEDAWSFKAVPYIWMSGLKGDVATLPGVPEASVDLSFGDLLRNLDIGGFVLGEARRGDLFFRGELAYASVSSSADTPGGLFSEADVTAKTFQGAVAVGYTVNRGADHQVDAFAGLRAWMIDTDLDLKAGRLPAQSVSHKETFVDPLIGASVSYQLAPGWSVAASGSVGGFGVAADLEWSATAGVTYHAGETWGLVLGYRYLSVDYNKNGFVYDVAQHGPLLGVVFGF